MVHVHYIGCYRPRSSEDLNYSITVLALSWYTMAGCSIWSKLKVNIRVNGATLIEEVLFAKYSIESFYCLYNVLFIKHAVKITRVNICLFSSMANRFERLES